MIKKIIACLAALIFLFSLTVSAAGVELTPYGEFYSFSQYPDKVADILTMEKAEIEDYCRLNNVTYLAVDAGNRRQIKLTETETDFSGSVKNLSNMDDNDILALVPELAGVKNCSGEIVDKLGQKFVKISLLATESDNNYNLTEYITVADSQEFVLSFIDSGDDEGYIEKTFNTFTSDDFLSKTSVLIYVLPVAIGVFLLISVAIIVSVIKDIRKKDEEQ